MELGQIVLTTFIVMMTMLLSVAVTLLRSNGRQLRRSTELATLSTLCEQQSTRLSELQKEHAELKAELSLQMREKVTTLEANAALKHANTNMAQRLSEKSDLLTIREVELNLERERLVAVTKKLDAINCENVALSSSISGLNNEICIVQKQLNASEDRWLTLNERYMLLSNQYTELTTSIEEHNGFTTLQKECLQAIQALAIPHTKMQ